MSAHTVRPFGGEGVVAPAPSDLVGRARDSLRAVSDRFAAANARRRERSRYRHETALPPADVVMRNLGDSFSLPLHARLL
ncbi:hypothetical protein QQX09_13135 [Demequina sp. SYSU T00192]|uniref:Uncharacterized protein n=1 Tax=Demequina litoralis TaxID=3051660 RepID=A0ABT8GCV2_9MICO|nr:hypothetical protein [Demequina sp. SYSU T00192]MDN4476797.1 hypothetical protein [Demequina sp. SYSU T00192]